MIAQSCPILSQQLSLPHEPLTLRITEFNSGVNLNVVPDTAVLRGTIRATSLSQRERAKQSFKMMATQIAIGHGGAAEIFFKDCIPPTINSELETTHVLNTARQCLGADKVQLKLLPARASEDFAFYLEKIPGCYFFIGNGEQSASCHSAHYDFNDKILPIAAELFCHVAIDFLNKK